MLRMVARDNTIARSMPRRSPLTSVMPALSIATSVPVPISMPTSDWASAGASIDAVTRHRHRAPVGLQALHLTGRIAVLKGRMNADLHMDNDLKNTGKGNLFVIFGEPDIDILPAEDGKVG